MKNFLPIVLALCMLLTSFLSGCLDDSNTDTPADNQNNGTLNNSSQPNTPNNSDTSNDPSIPSDNPTIQKPDVPYSEGLKYTVSEDRTYFVVTGKGTCTDNIISIPPTYEGLPVKQLGGSNGATKCYLDKVHTIILPDSITTIGLTSAKECKNIWFGQNTETIVQLSLGLDAVNIYIPELITWCQIEKDNWIAPYNLYINQQLVTNLVIPDPITEISAYAFRGCRSIETVTFGNSVVSIGENAFCSCVKLNQITFGNTLTFIGEQAFSYCLELKSIDINGAITSIGNEAFYSCEQLKSVNIGNSVTSIGERAFAYCKSMTDVTIGSSVTSIGGNAFVECDMLLRATFENTDGWSIARQTGSGDIENKTVLDPEELSNPATAAMHLTHKETARSFLWTRQ